MRTFATRVVNPIVRRLGLAGGRRSAWGLITISGRRTGTVRTLPVLPHVAGNVVLIPMSYGEEVQWVRNVLATGQASLRYRGRILDLANPRLVDLEEVAPILPERAADQYARLRIRRFLRLEAVGRTSA
jgi:deazaflavin-dependent oxidoreductase (nitroreductase family)